MVNWVKSVKLTNDYPELYTAELLDGRKIFMRYDLGVLIVSISEDGFKYKTIYKMKFGDVGDMHLNMSEIDLKIMILDILEKNHNY